ncbi:MAG: 23S rRNA (adenine(2503)-C(2))-methyltransferase RlmN [Oscillospiraceae bacterium]
MDMKQDILSMNHAELAELMKSFGQPAFRAKQIFLWLHQRSASSFDEMTNLPATLRARLKALCTINHPVLLREQNASDAVKFLWELSDGNAVESVFMRHDYGSSLCISTQVGCRMGCAFCASTIGGLMRNLTPAEMLGQIYAAAAATGQRVDRVVLMGIGEPLDNFSNVLRFLELLHDPDGLGLSHRHISLSTCGIVPQIDELAALRLQLTLSISLHATDNITRDSLMPINRRYPIEELLCACKNYFSVTGRRISYEYALISGVNDSPSEAKRLAGLLSDQPCHVNLIPLNPVQGKLFSQTGRQEAERFREIIASAGLSCTIRRAFGGEIDAACGQLRRNRGTEYNKGGN